MKKRVNLYIDEWLMRISRKKALDIGTSVSKVVEEFLIKWNEHKKLKIKRGE